MELHNSFDPKQARWHAPGNPQVKAPEKAGPVCQVPSTFSARRPHRTVTPRQRSNHITVKFWFKPRLARPRF